MTLKDDLSKVLMENKLRNFTISTFILIILFPFLLGGYKQELILTSLATFVIFFGVYAVSQNRRNVIIAMAFGLPWIVLSWIDFFVEISFWLDTLIDLLLVFFLTFAAICILSFILNSDEVNVEILYGAVSVYLLIGFIWMALYQLLEVLQPGSFYFNPIHNIQTIASKADFFLYYSFTTLTSSAYGDIMPITPHARALSYLESLVGIIYLAILIAHLLGLYIAQKSNT